MHGYQFVITLIWSSLCTQHSMMDLFMGSKASARDTLKWIFSSYSINQFDKMQIQFHINTIINLNFAKSTFKYPQKTNAHVVNE